MSDEIINVLAWADQVAAAMPDGWRADIGAQNETGRDDAYMTGPDGERIHVRRGQWNEQGKAVVSWAIPWELAKRHERYDESTRKEINVSLAKRPEVAARDIVRRLLPGLAEMVATINERAAKAAQRAATGLRVMERVAAAAGTQVRNDARRGDDYDPIVYVHSEGYSHNGKVTVNHTGETCKLEDLTLNADLMVEVVAFIAERMGK